MTLRSAFARTVIDLMERDDRLIVMLGDIGVHAFRDAFSRWPKRCINAGICESASVDMAAGLAMSGYYPIYSTIDSFLVRRAYEALYIGFGLQRLPGLFVGLGGTSDYRRLGPTHQCAENRTLMDQIPGMKVLTPASERYASEVIARAIAARQLTYISLEESLAVALDDNVVPLHLGANNGHAIPAGADG